MPASYNLSFRCVCGGGIFFGAALSGGTFGKPMFNPPQITGIMGCFDGQAAEDIQRCGRAILFQ